MFISGTWQPVADSNMSWTVNNTEVVCRQLGYDTNSMFSVSIRSVHFIYKVQCLLHSAKTRYYCDSILAANTWCKLYYGFLFQICYTSLNIIIRGILVLTR